MGQKYKDDKIGTLSHNAGTITLTASRLTIGGQQYTTGSLQHVLGTMASSTLYMLYVVLSGGTPTLVKSTNFNSSGPAGFTSWKLVGAMYSNGITTPVFGSFVNIDGKPCSDFIDYTFTIVDAGLNNVISASPITAVAKFARDGNQIQIHWAYYQTGVVGSAGSGAYQLGTPAGLTAAPNLSPGAGNTNSHYGTAMGDIGGSLPSIFNCEPLQSSARFRVQNRVAEGSTSTAGFSSSGAYPMNTANLGITGWLKYPVTQWSNTPLKDL